MIAVGEVAFKPVHWAPSYRLIASRFPTVGLYDAIAHPDDLDVVYAIEALTNARLRNELGQLHLVPKPERVTGPGATLITAAFTHLNPEGSRFSDASYGVYYASSTLDCALAEVMHHRAKFLARTNEAPIDIDMRLVLADVDAPLHDLRGMAEQAGELYDPDVYTHAQGFGRASRASGSYGVVYDSVRHAGGQCVGVFRPRALAHARADQYFGLHWDGRRVSHWYQKGNPTPVASGMQCSPFMGGRGELLQERG
jgi:hypothetical protein